MKIKPSFLRIPPYLKEIAYNVGIKHGTSEDWLILWKRFLKSEIHSEKELMITALASIDNSSLIFK